MQYDVIIIGGGAAGLMCAAVAGARGRQVLVIEHANRVGKKILMSGGGRCNFTHLNLTPDHFLSANPHFCKSALARYTPQDFVALVERHRIAYHEKEPGQLFCDESSRLIVRMLLDECAAANVEITTGRAVQGIAWEAGQYAVQTADARVTTGSLVIASGGLSIPKMGATGFGYAVARQFGMSLRPTRAGLVPVTLGDAFREFCDELSGVSLPATVSAGDATFRGGLLITHRGLSGPAVLQVSSYWQPGEDLELNLLPDIDVPVFLRQQQIERPATELKTLLSEVLPRRLVQRLCDSWAENRPLRQLRPAQVQEIARRLDSWRVRPSGTEGYRTAEVTLGGVDTAGLSSTTMESRTQPGLYFIGEVVDVTGQLGGFNFQWAWASGHAAGQVA